MIQFSKPSQTKIMAPIKKSFSTFELMDTQGTLTSILRIIADLTTPFLEELTWTDPSPFLMHQILLPRICEILIIFDLHSNLPSSICSGIH